MNKAASMQPAAAFQYAGEGSDIGLDWQRIRAIAVAGLLHSWICAGKGHSRRVGVMLHTLASVYVNTSACAGTAIAVTIMKKIRCTDLQVKTDRASF